MKRKAGRFRSILLGLTISLQCGFGLYPIGSVYGKMELSQLKYFVAIANYGSFTKAAETLYVT
ncbi:LysR family transcriptional regulator [Acaryochloris sp. 'Moss Beach']|nr:LysR family transcriptional regulator [Acaryochloris sp. 'Moss Beach']UJB67669.1 LysR family transcriptional regulator [Acaryochloris sp. 'Moss Beach']